MANSSAETKLQVYVVETEYRGNWFIWACEEYRESAWERMRWAREKHPGSRFRTRTYRPAK